MGSGHSYSNHAGGSDHSRCGKQRCRDCFPRSAPVGPVLRIGDMMPDMPGTNLTRDEAQTRARLLDVGSYTVELDLTTSETTFATTTTIAFTCTQPGAETFADLVGATIHELSLNGTPLDPHEVYADNRIRLTDLA